MVSYTSLNEEYTCFWICSSHCTHLLLYFHRGYFPYKTIALRKHLERWWQLCDSLYSGFEVTKKKILATQQREQQITKINTLNVSKWHNHPSLLTWAKIHKEATDLGCLYFFQPLLTQLH